MFVTVVLAVYELSTGKCFIARGGHPAPVLRGKSAAREIDCAAGCLIGIMEDAPTIGECVLNLEFGDIVVFYTDGVTEAAENGIGQMFGQQRLNQSISALPIGGPLQDHLKQLTSEVDQFSGARTAQDDLTLLLIRRLD
jgi:phosphoserine phosphatase RsbU/P